MNNDKMVSVPFKALRDFLEHSACTYKGSEWTKNKGALRHAMSQCSEVDPQCSEVLRTQGDPVEQNIEEAAKTLAACMDYPWEHMPENGRALMRKHAKDVIDAAKEPNQ